MAGRSKSMRGLSGLGALGKAASGKKAQGTVSKGVKHVVTNFVAGRKGKACGPVKGGGKVCSADTDGKELNIRGQRVAFRSSIESNKMTVCPARLARTDAGRTGANILLSAVKAGFRSGQHEGDEYLIGKNRGGGMVANSECFEVHVSKGARAKAKKNAAEAQKKLDAAAKRAAKKAPESAAAAATATAARTSDPTVAANYRSLLVDYSAAIAAKNARAAEDKRDEADRNRMGSDFQGLRGLSRKRRKSRR